jgi:thiamine-phosphate pyrophosphorylase
MEFRLPRLYTIVDSELVPHQPSKDRATEIAIFARELADGGATLIQYRNKKDAGLKVISQAREIRRILFAGKSAAKLIMNDRADLCLAANFDGVHLGQDDISVSGARKLCRAPLLVGVSTHNPEQVRQAELTDADYIAIGPVFGTASKQNPDPVVGVKGVRLARSVTKKPLVAIGGITRANCREVIAAGADSVAVISDLLNEPREACKEFIQLLG